MRKIEIVSIYDKSSYRKMLNEYLIELSQFDDNVEFDENKVPVYKWFDCYWQESSRYPFILKIDGNAAGLCMVRELGTKVYEIAEFYVKPEYRKDNNAIWFATAILDLFEGNFVFSAKFTNPRAIKFWGKFLNTFKNATYFNDETFRNFEIKRNNFSSHTLTLKKVYFDLIKGDVKTLEGRLNDEKRQAMQIGDVIEFCLNDDKTNKFLAKITNKFVYKNFDEMIKCTDKQKLGFAGYKDEQVVDVYRGIYPKEKEQKYGVVILEIEKL